MQPPLCAALPLQQQTPGDRTGSPYSLPNVLQSFFQQSVTLTSLVCTISLFGVYALRLLFRMTSNLLHYFGLPQIGEIVNLWVSCQDKWMFLSKVFSGEPTFTSSFEHLLPKFKEVDKQYRVFIHTMVQDPKVLSVLSR